MKVVLARAIRDYPYLDTPAGRPVLEQIMARRDELVSQGMYPSIALVNAINDHVPARPVAKEVPTRVASPQAASAPQPASYNSFPPECRWVIPSQWSCK